MVNAVQLVSDIGRWALVALAAMAGVVGLGLLIDRPGLETEYFANSPNWQGEPVFTSVETPELAEGEDPGVFFSTETFSLRWRGWIRTSGEETRPLFIYSDEGAYAVFDGELAVDRRGRNGSTRALVRSDLGDELHHLELGLSQTGKESRFALRFGEAASSSAEIPADFLFAKRPVVFYRLLRTLTRQWSRFERQLLGSLLLLAFALRMLRPGSSLLVGLAQVRTRLPALENHRRLLGWLALAAVFGVALVSAFPFTASTAGGDDVRYLFEAAFGESMTGYGRPVHVYLLKLFIALAGGDVFQGARLFWAFMFAVTVAAVVGGIAALGPGLQVRTQMVGLFLLFSQGNIMSRFGATFPDFTAGMFVTVSVAVYLSMLAAQDRSSKRPPGRSWAAAAIGLVTVLAVFSKETGIIAACLPALFLWHEGRVDLGQFAKKMGYWAAGVAAGLLLILAADACIGGDVWRSLRPEHVTAVIDINFEDEVRSSRRTATGWLNTIFQTGSDDGIVDYAPRHLWLLTFLAAFVAAARRKHLQEILLHLLPLVYLIMMLVLQTAAFYPLYWRYMLPIMPVCCVLVASMFRDLGIEHPSWSELLRSRNLVLLYCVAVVCLLVFIPYRLGPLEASELVPQNLLAGLGWSPADFVASIAGPVAFLILFAAGLFGIRDRGLRFGVLVGGLLLLFGVGFENNRLALEKHHMVQRGDLILYPWSAFRDVIESEQPATIQVSPELFRKRRMVGQLAVRANVARLFFRRAELKTWQASKLSPNADLAIAGKYDFNSWREQIPGLEDTSSFDPTGQLVLVRPRKAAEKRSAPKGKAPE